MSKVTVGFNYNGIFILLIIIVTLLFIQPVNAQIFGDGSDGAVTVSSTIHLTRDVHFTDLTINSGGGLIETHGFVIYVSGTFYNKGDIKDSFSGGEGGTGGAGGIGGNGHSPHNPPTQGTVGSLGFSGSIAGAGDGGNGGSGGGGGGGAWDILHNRSVSGGNGGSGGKGGKGGGVITIYARIFDNRTRIKAEGFEGEAGGWGYNGSYLSYNNSVFPYGTLDMASGGGGGGFGGNGGDGGTITIYYQEMISEGFLSVSGGFGGNSSYGGGIEYCYYNSGGAQVEEDGALAGGSTWREGGRSEVDVGNSVQGAGGANGISGNNGTIMQYHVPRCYVDADNDGFGDSADPGTDMIGSCGVGYSTDNSDCDDTNYSTNPDATEICDGKDNDCINGIPFDEIDADGDGVSPCEGDCFDGNINIYPGNIETLCNGVDDDCDPLTLDDPNADGDPVSFCAGDCNDGESSIYPGATEIPDDGIDQDCDGFDLISNCCNMAGDANNDEIVGISDLTYFVDYMFNSGVAPICQNEFDNQADCTLGISDLTYFVDYMFNSGVEPLCGCVE